MKTVIQRLQKQFPNVTRVVDAKQGVRIEVQPKDSSAGRKKDPADCALAKACVRSLKLDGAVIGITFSYLINGNTATRYKTSVAVGREITSFDRHHDFAEGKDYLLSRVAPASRLGSWGKRTRKPRASHRAKEKYVSHRTANIRVVANL